MGTWGGRRAAGFVVAALVAGGLTGCGDHASGGLTTPTAPSAVQSSAGAGQTGSASSASGTPTSSTASGTAEKARIRAARDAGKPAEDLVWRLHTTPKSWTKLPKAADGKQKWFAKPGCYVTVWQLDGARSAKTSRGVLKTMAAATSADFPGKPKPAYRSRSTTKVTGFVVGLNEFSTVKMAQAIVDYGTARTEILAYRDDDMALTYISSCRTVASFKKVAASDFDGFRDALIAEFTY